ncbi:MAG: Ig-like domain-containing protein [Muribaculaceae bacterium]|nr:Ig-like domain-containing protein [Muribaculaceae bacterium]
MTEPTAMKSEGTTSFSGHAGDTFQCNAKLTPEDVSLPYIFWSSTNPKVATVDSNGLVTLQKYYAEDITRADGKESTDGTCRIIAESLYFNGPIAEFTINNTDFNGVGIVTVDNSHTIDYSRPFDVYNMSGQKVGETTEVLSKGIYIIRQGKAAVKTVVIQ